jgi:putative transposase
MGVSDTSRIPPWETAETADWALARQRETVIRPLLDAPLTVVRADEAARALSVTRTLLYRLLARYRRRRHTSSLLPRTRGRTRHVVQLDEEREAIIQTAIEQVYLTEQRPSLTELLRAIRITCHQQKRRAPNYRTVRRRVESLDRKLVIARRFGAAIARDTFAPVGPGAFDDLLPLDLVQIDHAYLDVLIVDERDRLPIGRPWLTLVIDVASRVVAGFTVSLEPPSTVSVALALTHAVLPKETWLADRNVDLAWPVAGIPEYIHADNAKEFEAEALVRGTQEYGMELIHRPVARPSYGGHIERLIGTMMGAVHLLPGTTSSNVHAKADYPSDARATLTLAELEHWLILEIAGTYHNRVHSALQRTPLDAWRAGLSRRSSPPRPPDDPLKFFVDFLPGVQRLIRRDGIRLFKIHYWANVLSPLAGRSLTPVLVKYDPRNLSRIYFQDATRAYWPVPYRDLRLPPISLWELRAARRLLRKEGHRVVDENGLVETVLAQRAIVDEARRQTSARRARERRPVPVSPLEADVPLSDTAVTTLPLDLSTVHVEEWDDD